MVAGRASWETARYSSFLSARGLPLQLRAACRQRRVRRWAVPSAGSLSACVWPLLIAGGRASTHNKQEEPGVVLFGLLSDSLAE